MVIINVRLSSDKDGYVSVDTEKNWVIESECSYHMFPKKDHFETSDRKEGGVIWITS